MIQDYAPTREAVAARLRSLVITPEVLRLIHDITTCTVEWEDHPDLTGIEPARGLPLFQIGRAHV